METNNSAEMNKIVMLAYDLWVDGEVMDSADRNDPLIYLQGHGNIIPGLEKEIEGMKPGEKKTVIVQPEEGYGVLIEDSLVELDRSLFPEDYDPEIGEMLTLQDENDEIITAFITAFDDQIIEVDLNHPLAGKDLKFDIEVIEVSDATDEDIAAGHIHSGCDVCGGCDGGECH